MVAVQNGSTVHHGEQTPAGSVIKSKALEVAQGGIETPFDITNFALAHSIDILQGAMGAKDANASLRGVTVGLRAVEVGHRVGSNRGVSKIAADGGTTSADADLRREAELTAELERIREKRAG